MEDELKELYFKYYEKYNNNSIIEDVFDINDTEFSEEHPLFAPIIDIYENFGCFQLIDGITHECFSNKLITLHKFLLLIVYSEDFLRMINDKQKITKRLKLNDDEDLSFIWYPLIKSIDRIYRDTKQDISFMQVFRILLHDKMKNLKMRESKKNTTMIKETYDWDGCTKDSYIIREILEKFFYDNLITKEIIIPKK